MAKIKIVYTAVPAPAVDASAQISRTFVPTNCAADMKAFAGTYYDTNVDGFGEGVSAEDFIKGSIAHPGLVLALKQAMLSGSYEFDCTDEKTIMYMQEVAPALVDQGFKITVGEAAAAEAKTE